MKITKREPWLFGALAVAVIAAGVLYRNLPSLQRSKLPDSATDIHEYDFGIGGCGDTAAILKARLPAKDFPIYAKRLGLTERYDPSVPRAAHDPLKNSLGGAPNWWNEPESLTNCYFRFTPGTDHVERVKWSDGWVYYLSIYW